jgi:helicase
VSIPSKKYFIVFDKSLQKGDEVHYNVNFFYLKSFKKKMSKLAYISQPFFQGYVVIGFDMRNKLRPLSFYKSNKDGIQEPINPKLFKKYLIGQNNVFIGFSSQAHEGDYTPIETMLKNFQFSKDKIKLLTFCSLCLEKKKFKILPKSFQIRTVKNEIVCPDCALNLVISQAEVRGLIPNKKVNPKLKNFFSHMILKFKDLNKIISSFKFDFNPAKNREITLYDVEKNPKIDEKLLNVPTESLEIPKELKNVVLEQNIKTLLPIQAISIEAGLLKKRTNQLIMAPTSAGKTLIGELAGVSQVLSKKEKMLYLVPIVALANVRTEEFKRKYQPLNLKIIKKIGESLLETIEVNDLNDLFDSDIIIATYEAIDYILRSGQKDKLGSIGTIIIDEIQTLIDLERGYIVDALISRLKCIYKDAQFLYLSATIGAPEILAQKLDCSLINYKNRPVPIERHLMMCINEAMKHRLIKRLVQYAFKQKSEYGFKGQSIIFTNTRKKCESLANYLTKRGIMTKSYHSGLTNEERKYIERKFQNQEIAAVVATAALAAGVDFAAKQVIFESLGMGIKTLTVAEFEQMLGRAGRLKKHSIGYAYLLIEPGKIYNPKMKTTEDNVAINLLNGKIKDFELEPNEDKSLTELLAMISTFSHGVSIMELMQFQNYLINGYYELNKFIDKLISFDLIEVNSDLRYFTTNLGNAIAKSFLTITKSFEIIDKLKKKEETLFNLILELNPIKNVYLSKSVVADLSKNMNMKYFSNNFFSASVLSLMNADYVRKRKKFSQEFISYVSKWTTDIFNCKCKDSPYCDCGRLNLEKKILSLRIEDKLSIEEIREYFEGEYKILIFKGDIIDYLENLIYTFESILHIAKAIDVLDIQYKRELEEIPNTILAIKVLNID